MAVRPINDFNSSLEYSIVMEKINNIEAKIADIKKPDPLLVELTDRFNRFEKKSDIRDEHLNKKLDSIIQTTR